MKVRIDTGEKHHIELSRDGDKVLMMCSEPGSGFPVVTGQTLDLNAIADLHAALAMFGAQLSGGEPEGDPESPWQVGGKVVFERGIYRGRVLTITGFDDEEDRYTLEGDGVTLRVTHRDLDAGAKPIE